MAVLRCVYLKASSSSILASVSRVGISLPSIFRGPFFGEFPGQRCLSLCRPSLPRGSSQALRHMVAADTLFRSCGPNTVDGLVFYLFLFQSQCNTPPFSCQWFCSWRPRYSHANLRKRFSDLLGFPRFCTSCPVFSANEPGYLVSFD